MDNDQNQQEQYDTEALDATQGLISRLSGQLDDLKKKQKEFREMLKGVYENDTQLNEAENKAQAITQEVKSRKADITATAEVQDIKMKITEVTEDLKLVQESLNTHLLNYYQMTNSMTVDLPDGTERDFVLKATLKPKKKS